MGLLKAIWEPILNRCKEQGNSADWWRKGFAYALIFSGPAKGNRGFLRIMPGVLVGPGGVVEAEGYLIRRPEDRKFSAEEIQDKSEELQGFTEGLKKSGFGR